jgi:hypothetical protein
MRQVCNVAYVTIIDTFVEEDELREFDEELPLSDAEVAARKRRQPKGRRQTPSRGSSSEYLDLTRMPGKEPVVANADKMPPRPRR